MTQTLFMRTLVQQFETLHSQITVQSTTGNKAKLTFQMIKLKHYHHVPCFFPPLDQNNWFASSELAGAKPIYDFSSELPG